MDLDHTTQRETLLESSPEATALRTHHLLIAARLVFAFAHGALIVAACLAAEWTDAPWETVFLPVWVGNTTCIGLIVASWFASCPYIQKCLEERQARYGDENPSILTELLPEIVLSFVGLAFMGITSIGEVFLCWYLDAIGSDNSQQSLTICASVLMTSGLLATLHGIFLRSNGDLFVFVGGGVFATFALAIAIPDGFNGAYSWVTVLPAVCSVAGITITSLRRFRFYTKEALLNREERILRLLELVVLTMVFIGVLLVLLACLGEAPAIRDAAGALSGGGLCIISVLRARITIVESRLDVTVSDRLMLWRARACPSDGDGEETPGYSRLAEGSCTLDAAGMQSATITRTSPVSHVRADTPTSQDDSKIRRTRSATDHANDAEE